MAVDVHTPCDISPWRARCFSFFPIFLVPGAQSSWKRGFDGLRDERQGTGSFVSARWVLVASCFFERNFLNKEVKRFQVVDLNAFYYLTTDI